MNPVRKAARDALPAGFLRIARRDALYISDAPRHIADGDECVEHLTKSGFTVSRAQGLLAITPCACWMEPVFHWAIARATPDAWMNALARFDGAPVAPEEWPLWIDGIKLSEGFGALEHYDRRLRQAAALCQRGGGGGALICCRALYLCAAQGLSGPDAV